MPDTAIAHWTPVLATSPSSIAETTSSETTPWRSTVSCGTPRNLSFQDVLYVTNAPANQAEEPGRSVHAAAMPPPVQDSAVASIHPLEASASATFPRVSLISPYVSIWMLRMFLQCDVGYERTTNARA